MPFFKLKIMFLSIFCTHIATTTFANSHLPLPKHHFLLYKHSFHISKSEIKYSQHDNSLQITTHIFLDDLEKALTKLTPNPLHIGTPTEAATTNAVLENYLKTHFQLTINDINITYNFIGKEMSSDYAAVWCYMEVKNMGSLKKIKVKNNILTEIYADQKNIINLTLPNGKQGYLMFDKYKVELTIDN
jgi:hypothetical protein